MRWLLLRVALVPTFFIVSWKTPLSPLRNLLQQLHLQPHQDSPPRPRHVAALIASATASMVLGSTILPALPAFGAEPSLADNQLVQQGFRDFDVRRFDAAEKEIGQAIARWRELDRPRDEIVSLVKTRANIRLDNKDFPGSLADCNEALKMMANDGEKEDGSARYPEYPDTFVARALAKEGLADWAGALDDYNRAIGLWGGGRGEGVNPYVLTFRGNVLTRLNRWADAVVDYEAASDRFIGIRDIARYSDARADLALALYQLGKTDDAVKVMNDVIRKTPGYGDMRVAIAADSWGKGDYITALKEWNFVCDRIDTGCKAYEDENWVRVVRRWPPALATKLEQFLRREIPDKLKGEGVLAPARS